jgi:hypothetical protein
MIPETPRWLAFHDQHDESLDVLRRLYYAKSSEDEILHMHKEIVAVAGYESALGAGSWRDLVKNDGETRRVIFIKFSKQLVSDDGSQRSKVGSAFSWHVLSKGLSRRGESMPSFVSQYDMLHWPAI